MLRKGTISRICQQCGTGFKTWPYAIAKGYGRYCSRRCAGRAHTALHAELPPSEPPVSCVYAIVHVATGQSYVGATSDVRQRWRTHRGELLRGASDQRLLQEAWNEYGEAAFDWRILERVPTALLLTREREWIARLRCLTDGLNAQDAGSGYGPRKRVGLQPMNDAQLRGLEMGRGPNRTITDEMRRKWSAHSANRLPDEKIQAILADASVLPTKTAIAKKHGVSRATVGEILSGTRRRAAR